MLLRAKGGFKGEQFEDVNRPTCREIDPLQELDLHFQKHAVTCHMVDTQNISRTQSCITKTI